jgi:flagellar biosynthetic protein FliQ
MTVESAIEMLRQLIMTSLMLISPILGAAIIIGLTISVIQTVTSIQEQTLVFVPKLVGCGLVIIAVSHWMLHSLIEFTVIQFQRIAQMGP